MYEHIIRHSQYQNLRIVTEPDQRHPCIKYMQNLTKHIKLSVTVESSSVLDDACKLMWSRNLAVNSHSTFTRVFGTLLNTVCVNLYTPFPEYIQMADNSTESIQTSVGKTTWTHQRKRQS
jgi:hypothetical protein